MSTTASSSLKILCSLHFNTFSQYRRRGERATCSVHVFLYDCPGSLYICMYTSGCFRSDLIYLLAAANPCCRHRCSLWRFYTDMIDRCVHLYTSLSLSLVLSLRWQQAAAAATTQHTHSRSSSSSKKYMPFHIHHNDIDVEIDISHTIRIILIWSFWFILTGVHNYHTSKILLRRK